MTFRALAATALLLAGCSGRTDQPQPAPTPSVAATPTPAPVTADARAAIEVAQQYLDHLGARRWRQAYALWDPASAGAFAAFAKASAADPVAHGKTGRPSEIRPSGGIDYILVDASVEAKDRSGKPADRFGTVMLKRAGAGAPWRIWGTDIRPRHCRAGERPEGLGCVKSQPSTGR